MSKTEMEDENLPGPLDGIRILEYGVFHAGPGASAILGDLGADIIKVEAFSGDPERYWTQVAGHDLSLKNNEGVIFDASNRNKKSICLDIKQEKGRKVFNRLLKNADVFLTNLRKSTKEKMGLDYAAIYKLVPHIIYASASGYGAEGPICDLGAFDPLGSARSGMMYTSGNEEPNLLHIGILDQATSITLSHAMITALYHRERTGVGQEVHVSLYSTGLWLQYMNLLIAGVLSLNPCKIGDRHEHSPLRTRFQCKDGKWIFGTHHPQNKYWGTFCKVMGQESLLKDPRFTTSSGEPDNYIELNKILDKVFETKTSSEWMDIFLSNGLMFCVVQNILDILKDPQALANDYLVPFEHRVQGQIKIPGYPIKFSNCRAETKSLAPQLGEHTNEVLEAAGYSTAQIEELKKTGVVK